MLDRYHKYLRVIQEEIGDPVLMQGTDASLSLRGKNHHPMRFHWRKSTQFLDGLAANRRDLTECTSLAFIERIGGDLEAVRGLRGYEARFPRRPDQLGRRFLDHPVEFIKNAYVFVIANEFLKRGCDVEFVPERSDDGVRTADLKVSQGDCYAWVECKRKHEITFAELTNEVSLRLTDRLKNVVTRHEGEFDVQVAIIGTDEQALEKVIDIVDRRLEEGDDGTFLDEELGASVSVSHELPSTPGALQLSSGGIPGVLSNWCSPGATLIYACIAPGSFLARHRKRAYVYALNSHGFNSVLNSFREACKQIPSGDQGAIFIDVDTNQLAEWNVARYLYLLTQLLEMRVWRGQNSRVASFGLTSEVLRKGQNGEWNLPIIAYNHLWCIRKEPIMPLPNCFNHGPEILKRRPGITLGLDGPEVAGLRLPRP